MWFTPARFADVYRVAISTQSHEAASNGPQDFFVDTTFEVKAFEMMEAYPYFIDMCFVSCNAPRRRCMNATRNADPLLRVVHARLGSTWHVNMMVASPAVDRLA